MGEQCGYRRVEIWGGVRQNGATDVKTWSSQNPPIHRLTHFIKSLRSYKCHIYSRNTPHFLESQVLLPCSPQLAAWPSFHDVAPCYFQPFEQLCNFGFISQLLGRQLRPEQCCWHCVAEDCRPLLWARCSGDAMAASSILERKQECSLHLRRKELPPGILIL